jgi:steroid delta-isomerase-like uncharacterized protein
MLTEELKSRARRLPEELLTQGDLAVADELVAPGCVHHAPAPLVCGIEGLKQWARALRRAFPDLCALVDDEIAEGDRVVQRLTLSGTHAGEFLGIPPTGKRVTWQLMAIQHLDPGGKVAEHWAIWDQLGLLRQLGAPPTVAGACTEGLG